MSSTVLGHKDGETCPAYSQAEDGTATCGMMVSPELYATKLKLQLFILFISMEAAFLGSSRDFQPLMDRDAPDADFIKLYLGAQVGCNSTDIEGIDKDILGDSRPNAVIYNERLKARAEGGK